MSPAGVSVTCSTSNADAATLARLMPPGVHYYGIDIAIPESAPNLLEMNIVEEPISFHGKKFDLAVAQGMFEYVGEFQVQKFAEITACSTRAASSS